MAAGRPIEYDAKKIAKEVTKYIDDCKDNHYLPTIEGLAVHLCVGRRTLYEWADPKGAHFHEEFSHIFEQLRAVQASMLIQNGLKGEYNPTITKLMLTKHDYYDKQDVTTGGNELPQPIMYGLSHNDGDQEGTPAK